MNNKIWEVVKTGSVVVLVVLILLYATGNLQTVFNLFRGKCEIKGNINAQGEQIYHMPNQLYYNRTEIDKNAGEKWFCNENEAVNAGWRKSKI